MGDAVELTKGTGATRAQRRSQNGRQTSVSGGEVVWCACRARKGRECSAEGANEQGNWASRVRSLKGRGCAEVAAERVDVGAFTAGTWARGQGRLTGGVRGAKRERVRAKRNGADRSAP
jgi:hypothetical protein